MINSIAPITIIQITTEKSPTPVNDVVSKDW